MADKVSKADRDTAIAQLRKLFPVGSTVPTVLRHVARSGMSRSISVLDRNSHDVTWLVTRATGDRFDPNHGGIRVGGVGMDMGFALVYGLSRTLYRDGFKCTGKPSCPSNDHVNERRDREAYEAGYRRGRKHSDPGYALTHRWV